MNKSNNDRFMELIDKWLTTRGFEKRVASNNEIFYIRNYSLIKTSVLDFTHTVVRLKQITPDQINDIENEIKTYSKTNKNIILNTLTGGNKFAKFFSNIVFLPYVIFYSDQVNDGSIQAIENQKPIGVTYYIVVDTSKEKTILPKKKLFLGIQNTDKVNLDCNSLFVPIYQSPVSIDQEQMDFLDEVRLLSVRDLSKIWRNRKFSKYYYRYLDFASRAIYDVTIGQGRNQEVKVLFAHYVSHACIVDLIQPNLSVGPSLMNALESASARVATDRLRDTWLRQYNSLVEEYVSSKKLITLGYCPDCKNIQTDIVEFDGINYVCPVSIQHHKIQHLIYILPEEVTKFSQLLNNKYQKRGLFG